MPYKFMQEKHVMKFASALQDLKVHFVLQEIMRNGKNVVLHNLIKRTMTLENNVEEYEINFRSEQWNKNFDIKLIDSCLW